MSINVSKKKAQGHVDIDTLVKEVLRIPYHAEREARSGVDFEKHWDVKRYRGSVEAIVWASAQVAARITENCLWIPKLIDDESYEYILRQLNESANLLIGEALTRTMDEEEIVGTFKKPLCDICKVEGAWLDAGHHRICAHCMDELVQIVFTRATDPENKQI